MEAQVLSTMSPMTETVTKKSLHGKLKGTMKQVSQDAYTNLLRHVQRLQELRQSVQFI